MKIEDIKKLSAEMNNVVQNIEFMRNYLSVLSSCVAKDGNVQDEAMVLYIALINDGALSNMEDQLDKISNVTHEAENFIHKVAEDLESKKLVFNPGGQINEAE